MSMEEVLAQVSDSRTDLARLIQAAAREEWPCVVVSSQAIEAWERRAPDAWTTVQEWLLSLDKPLVIVFRHRRPSDSAPARRKDPEKDQASEAP